MRCVVDTNILFSFFWKESFLKTILAEQQIKLYAPEYALEEIKRHAPDIEKRADLSADEWIKLLAELGGQIVFVPLEKYASSFSLIIGISQHFSEQEKEELLKDADFLALAIELRCPLWSHDKLLKKQSILLVINTQELLMLLPENNS